MAQPCLTRPQAGRGILHAGRRNVVLPGGTISRPGHGRTAGFNHASSVASYQQLRLQFLRQAQSAMTEVAEVEPPAAVESPVTAMDIRIGTVIKCEKHPDADSLYVEEVNVGEPEPRTIVSGLVQFVPLEEMQQRQVVVLCNLKPRNMRGIKSHGMLLCASNDAHDAVEPLCPPEGAAVGERVWFGEDKQQAAPAEANRVQKKKLWEAVQPELKTSADKVAGYQGQAMMTSAGPVTAPTLAAANIS